MGRYVLLPAICMTHSWGMAQRFFQREGRRVLELANPLSDNEMTARVLVHGILGIEDSSRFWSVAMAMEHLIIVGDTMTRIIVDLTHNRPPSAHVNIADVKPHGTIPAAKIVQDYGELLARSRKRCLEQIGKHRAPQRLNHPWFGEITAHQWHCLAAWHQRIHRRQIEAIIKSVGRVPPATGSFGPWMGGPSL